VRNDLTYLRFYWQAGEREFVSEYVLQPALEALEDAFRQATKFFVGRKIDIRIREAGAHRYLCIEIPLAVDILDVGSTAIQLAEHAPHAVERIVAWANENEGVLGLSQLIWAALCGAPLWQLYRDRKIKSHDEPEQAPDEPISSHRVAVLEISTALIAHQNTRQLMTKFLKTAFECGANRIEIQFRDAPPGVILPLEPADPRGRRRGTGKNPPGKKAKT